MEQTPLITIAMAVFNEERMIGRCLESIKRQDYPADRIEVLVADGGSKDRTREIIKDYGYTVIHNPLRLAEPGFALAYSQARGDLVVHFAADNVLRERNWLSEMARPFVENPNVIGALCKVGWDEEDDPFLKYFNSDTDPFSVFFYWNASHPDKFRKMYPVKQETDHYVIYQFNTRYFPLIATAQAFTLRRSYQRPPETIHDDLLPVIDMIAKGYDIAYVKTVTLGHYIFDNFRHYSRRMLQKTSESFTIPAHGFHVREKDMPLSRRIRQYLFVPYALTVVGPLLSSIRHAVANRRLFYFYQVPASFLLGAFILYLFIIVRVLKIRKTPYWSDRIV